MERDRGTEGETLCPIPGNWCAHRRRRTEQKAEKKERNKERAPNLATPGHLVASYNLYGSYGRHILSFHHTLFGLPPPTLTEPHTSLALSTIACVTCSHKWSTLFSPSHSSFFPPRDLVYPSLYWCFLSFSFLILLAPSTTSLLLIHTPTNLTLPGCYLLWDTPHLILIK